MPKPGWKVLWVDSEEALRESGDAENAIDGQADTHWPTAWSTEKPGYPYRLVIDLLGSEWGIDPRPRPSARALVRSCVRRGGMIFESTVPLF